LISASHGRGVDDRCGGTTIRADTPSSTFTRPASRVQRRVQAAACSRHPRALAGREARQPAMIEAVTIDVGGRASAGRARGPQQPASPLSQPKFWASRGSRRPSAWCSSSGIPTQRSRFRPGASACGCRISRGRVWILNGDPKRDDDASAVRRISLGGVQAVLKASTTNGRSRGLMRPPQAEGEATVSSAALSGLHAADLVPMHRLTARGVLVGGVSPTHRGRACSARRSRASRTSWSRSGPA
jgi:hypothetical protein